MHTCCMKVCLVTKEFRLAKFSGKQFYLLSSSMKWDPDDTVHVNNITTMAIQREYILTQGTVHVQSVHGINAFPGDNINLYAHVQLQYMGHAEAKLHVHVYPLGMYTT